MIRDSIDSRLQLSERGRAAGLADTPQRRLILEVLAESHDHPTAEEVYARVRKRSRRISLATVYRNLKLFAERGLVEEVATEGSFARFDANPAKHHHLVCTRCDKVSDYYSDDFDRLGQLGEPIDGFVVRDVKVNLYGLCPACRQEPGASAR